MCQDLHISGKNNIICKVIHFFFSTRNRYGNKTAEIKINKKRFRYNKIKKEITFGRQSNAKEMLQINMKNYKLFEMAGL